MTRIALIVTLAALAVLVLVWRHREGMEASPAIVGGQPAKFARYPWYCAMHYMRKSGGPPTDADFFCGGALIHPRVVLTAYHCLDGLGMPTHVVVGGNETHVIQSVARVKPLVGTGLTQENDMAVVILPKPSRHPPIKLAKGYPPNGTRLMAIGKGMKAFGVLGDMTFAQLRSRYMDNKSLTAILQQERRNPPSDKDMKDAFVNLVDTAIQALSMKEVGGALSDAGSVCHGDSGGPIFIDKGLGKDELLGVTSASIYCGKFNKQKVSVFTAVPPKMPYITQALRAFGYGSSPYPR